MGIYHAGQGKLTACIWNVQDIPGVPGPINEADITDVGGVGVGVVRDVSGACSFIFIVRAAALMRNTYSCRH